MVSYSFYVGLFHPQLYAGLSRRFQGVPFHSKILGLLATAQLTPGFPLVKRWFSDKNETLILRYLGAIINKQEDEQILCLAVWYDMPKVVQY